MTERTFRPSRKWQTIQYTAKGRAFIRIRNERYYLDDFEAYPVKEAGIKWDGVFNLTFFSCYFIRFSPDMEQAQYCYSFS